tara:strand:+ start:6324 stop:6467 length:144 start_codon:yes stop_codon:yes gene_type:complete
MSQNSISEENFHKYLRALAERLKDAEERIEELEDKLDRIKIINMEEK